MAYIGNTPGQATILRLEARKSFALGVRINDPRGRPVDLTDCELTIVAKAPPITGDDEATNLLAPDAVAILEEPKDGYAKFELQAATLDHAPGEYPYAIVLRTSEGYSSVIVKGTLEIVQNTEFASVDSSYSGGTPGRVIDVLLKDFNELRLYVGSQLPPGMNYVRDDVLATIENFDPDSVAMVPPGGQPGYVLTKNSSGDYAMSWLPVGNGAFALDASGQPAGNVPVAVGDDTWIWGAVGIDATGQPAGWAPIADGNGGWEWAPIQTDPPDWDASPGQPGEILNKPLLGSAAAADTGDFISSGTLVSEMPGIHFTSTVPTSGQDGHLYFVFTE